MNTRNTIALRRSSEIGMKIKRSLFAKATKAISSLLALALLGSIVVSAPGLRAAEEARGQESDDPVDVLFISDNATWISVVGPVNKKPRKLGKSTFRLVPGEYAIVGRKKGYKEVRMRLQIKKGVQPPPVTIICHKKRD